MKNIFLISVLFLSSCQIYTGVILDKVTPGTRKEYPISDTNSCAIKVKLLPTQGVLWCKDVLCLNEYNSGDTIQFYITNMKKPKIYIP